MAELLYRDLSYKLNGIFFETFRVLGFGYREKTYCKTIKELLKQAGISAKYQYQAPIIVNDKRVATRYFDFFVDNKIIIEVKVGNKPGVNDFKQIKEYLKISNVKLGLLVLFTEHEAKVYRVCNEY